MEERSSRCVRILVALMARRGLDVNEIACTLISMVAPSMTRSNVRPDTLMRDPHPTDRQNLLQRAAGPYIRARRRQGRWPSGPLASHVLNGGFSALSPVFASN
jgi:hypothetical protein